ncbi:hypothetical protein BDZ88DRAFT_406657 [Geranomyces variabilis]|nr:hypothetical protein BDZ88DRAFT_406657 [Geranomyces variabilis]KAJ3139679.1 hypothetical protein HDU90_009180 [Geranomyces variabilis]
MLARSVFIACLSAFIASARSVAAAGPFDAERWAAAHNWTAGPPTGDADSQTAVAAAAADGPSSSSNAPDLRPPPLSKLALNETLQSASGGSKYSVADLSASQKSDIIRLAELVIASSVTPDVALFAAGRNCSYLRANWTCTAGFFCQDPSENGNVTHPPPESNRCSPGFLCPPDTYQPLYCCPGFYCPTPANVFTCPEGNWCPVGTTRPLTCSFLAWCPEGTEAAPRFGVAAFLAGTFIVMTGFFQVRRWSMRKRNVKYRKRLDVKEAQKEDAAMSSEHADSQSPEDFEFDDTETLADTPIETPVPSVAGGIRRFDIEFDNLGLTLPDGVEIMKGVSGTLKAGRLCAVMGPSGAGKTTFVSLLTNKAKRSEGTVRINGNVEELSTYRKLIGFVPQEDIMLRELTVRDILMHSALMRLPVEWSIQRKKGLVLDTIAFLGLEHVMNSTVGDEVERGISGGQRKRVNIGMELVAAPSVLFLDEPTSGLDSATSYEVCKLLHTIAREQSMTIASIIHSPSPPSFEQFDDLLLLGKGGRIVYFGPRAEASAYFASIGFENKQEASPSDFFMDIATGRVPCAFLKAFKPPMLFACWEYKMQGSDPALGLKTRFIVQRKKTMIQRLETKSQFLAIGASILLSWGQYWTDVSQEMWHTARQVFAQDPIRSTPNLLMVFWLCYKRACSQLYRSRSGFWFDQMVHLLCGIFISVATLNNDYVGLFPQKMCELAPPSLQAGIGCGKPGDGLAVSGMFISLGILFAGVTVGGATFGRERVVFWRDVASGMPALPYFFAKWIADIPRMLIANVMFTCALVLLLPFHSDLASIFLLVQMLYLAAFSLGYFLSSLLEPSAVPLATTGFVLLWAMLFGGVTPDLWMVNRDPAFAPFRWIWGISAPRWTIEAWYIKESQARPWRELHEDDLSHDYHRDNYGKALGAVAYIAVGWALMALVALKLVNRGKQK